MLEGLKVVEMATYIAAPAAGGMLADWGADVIKIEAPKGDPIRHFFAGSNAEHLGNPVFDVDNRGKRALAIDIKDERGAEVLRKLLLDADVFLTNVRPSALERAGLDFESVHKVNPKLIYASVTGYGLEGPEKDRPGFDMAAFWARSGQSLLTQRKGEPPLPMRVAVGDHTTAMAMLSGILAAVIERGNTGKGRLVETSLLRTGIYSMASDMSIQQRLGRVGSTKSRHEAMEPLTNIYQTGDGHWVMQLTRQGQNDLPAMTDALNIPEVAEDERFQTLKGRRKYSKELVDIFDEAYTKMTLAEVGPRLDAHDLIWAPVQHPKDVINDPQAIAAGAFTTMPSTSGEGVDGTIASPVKFHGEGGETEPKGPAPKVGEHSAAILADLGYDEATITAMIEDRVLRAS
ncbi:MAG: CaiB/BaiF CoA transferase family protein [Alphaproteobacteria bacterium]